jgi:pimeloyl-ACP methyl ester carboxylesterase
MLMVRRSRLGEGGSRPPAGHFRCGLPYNRTGDGPRTLLVLQGLLPENKPQPGWSVRMYRFLGREYTVYTVLRRPGLPQGYTLRDMAAEYATLVRDELGGGPVDVIGVSTGGSIAQHLAADHPESVRRLVIHSSAHALSRPARRLQLLVRDLALRGDWVGVWRLFVDAVFPRHGLAGAFRRPMVELSARLLGLLDARSDPSDLAVTIMAEDEHAFRDRLGEIAAPTLVIAGAEDPFYTVDLFRETAEGIPGARLVLYPGMGHPATGAAFRREVLGFLLGTYQGRCAPRPGGQAA